VPLRRDKYASLSPSGDTIGQVLRTLVSRVTDCARAGVAAASAIGAADDADDARDAGDAGADDAADRAGRVIDSRLLRTVCSVNAS
jgi:hypothetical protein